MPQALRQGIGYEVAASSRPCRAIGGDFIDYFNLPDGAFAFVLGDVAERGAGRGTRQQCCRACSPRMPIAVVRPRPRCVRPTTRWCVAELTPGLRPPCTRCSP